MDAPKKLEGAYAVKPQLEHNCDCPLQLVMDVLKKLEGAYAVLVKSIHYPGELVACKRGSPMILGIKVGGGAADGGRGHQGKGGVSLLGGDMGDTETIMGVSGGRIGSRDRAEGLSPQPPLRGATDGS